MVTPGKGPARRRLVRAFAATAVALAAMVAASQGDVSSPRLRDQVLAVGGAVAVVVAGFVAVRALATAARGTFDDVGTDARGASLALVVRAVGYVVVLLTALGLLGVPMSGLLLGGALTGVVVGLAAQQVLANFFAGIVLAVVRPFTVGEHVVLRSGPLAGEYEGKVADMSLFYVLLETADGPVALPNSGVLAAAIGPGARTPKREG